MKKKYNFSDVILEYFQDRSTSVREAKGFPLREKTFIPKRWLLKLATITFILLIFCISVVSCKKLVEVGPPVTNINANNVYTTDATAAAVLTGIYTQISGSDPTSGGLTSLSFLLGLSADELNLYSGVSNTLLLQYYQNSLSSSTAGTGNFWTNIYPLVFITNSAIEGLNNSNTLTPAVKQQLLGEAKFMRAFCYFYLVNLYGDVPLVLGTDYTVNATLSRTSKVKVWEQIIGDLREAQSLLNSNYVEADAFTSTSATERVRPSKWAATALLARAYLYTGNLAGADSAATVIIDNSALFGLNSLNNAFLKASLGNKEAIWQLQPVISVINTYDAYVFILPSSGPNNYGQQFYLNNSLLDSFEIGDQRKINWINSVTVGSTTYFYPYKYKVNEFNAPITEYLMVLRLAEQYLIRAEARAQHDDISGAQTDLNIIRTRAGLNNTVANDKPSLIKAILHERQVELFTEWGHRWLDLKRSNTIDAVMDTAALNKGGSWSSFKALYPIPKIELDKASQLVQNPGY